MKRFTTRQLTLAAVIAAIYAVLCLLLRPISFGPVQCRVSEALTVLPYLVPSTMWGLFVGCFLANLLGGFGILDMVFGRLASLFAGWLTSKCKSPFLAPLPPVVVNALVIGGVLTAAYTGTDGAQPYYFFAIQIFPEQAVACYGLGLPLLLLLKRTNVLKIE